MSKTAVKIDKRKDMYQDYLKWLKVKKNTKQSKR